MERWSPRYQAYMLRLWQTGAGKHTVWRASLEDPRTGDISMFADLQALFAFLEGLTGDEHSSDTTVGDNSGPLDPTNR